MGKLRAEFFPQLDAEKLHQVEEICGRLFYFAQGMLPGHRRSDDEQKEISSLLLEYNALTGKDYRLADFDDAIGSDERAELDLLLRPPKHFTITDGEFCELLERIREFSGTRTELEYFKSLVAVYFPCFGNADNFYIFPEKSAEEIFELAKNDRL